MLVTKLCLRQKKQKHPLKIKFWTKKNMTSKIFERRRASCFKISKEIVVEGVFFYEGKPEFECIKAEDFR